MGNTNSYCANVITENPVTFFGRKIGAVMFIIGICYLVTALLVIYFIKAQERRALAGSDSAVKSVIFPVFVYVLWANVVFNAYVGIIALTLTFSPDQYNNPASVWAFSLMWALQHALVEGVAFLLMRKGLGWNAARKVLRRSLLWGGFTLVTKLGLYYTFDSHSLISLLINLTWQFILLFFYLALWLTPPRRLFRRTAAYFYSKMWAIFRVASIIGTLLSYYPDTSAFGNCFNIYGLILLFALFEPILVYYTLLQDSRWWQGMNIEPKLVNSEVEAIKLVFFFSLMKYA